MSAPYASWFWLIPLGIVVAFVLFLALAFWAFWRLEDK